MERIIREAIEIRLYPNNMKSKEDFCLSKSWKLLLHPPPKRKSDLFLISNIPEPAQNPFPLLL
jgi:hypothetical protein